MKNYYLRNDFFSGQFNTNWNFMNAFKLYKNTANKMPQK